MGNSIAETVQRGHRLPFPATIRIESFGDGQNLRRIQLFEGRRVWDTLRYVSTHLLFNKQLALQDNRQRVDRLRLQIGQMPNEAVEVLRQLLKKHEPVYSLRVEQVEPTDKVSLSISRQLAQIEGSHAATRGLSHSANPHGFTEWELMLSWSHGWLVARVQAETGQALLPTAPPLSSVFGSPSSVIGPPSSVA